MKPGFVLVGQLALSVFALGTLVDSPLWAQETPPAPVGLPAYQLPLAAIPTHGLMVSPFFEGWYENPDGTYTFSFGYFNRNREELIEIPIGDDNRIEPAGFDGVQPTTFNPRGGGERIRGRLGQSVGAFGVTVPGEFAESGVDVVWTIQLRGEAHRVPGRISSPAYQMNHGPMAMGSVPPRVAVGGGDSSWGQGPGGIWGGSHSVSAGSPLELAVNVAPVDDLGTPLGVTWIKHQGPAGGVVSFEDPAHTLPGEGGEVRTTATFSMPGEYVVRARVDNHGAMDSNPSDQCCWTNGFIPVTVTP